MINESLKKKVSPVDLDRYLNLIDSRSFDFDLLGFENIVSDFFYSGGILTDVEISQSKMQDFLKKYDRPLELLANEHLKRISGNEL